MHKLTWAAFAACVGCSFPGVRPPGERLAVFGSAPAPREPVFARAKGYYDRSGYTITVERPGERLLGYRVTERDPSSETRAMLEFTITRSSETETQYRIDSRTEIETPSTTRASQSLPEANTATGALNDWLSCGQARWPACP